MPRVSTLVAIGVAASSLTLAPLLAANDFDHMRTGFPLTGAHERVDCESCHLRGVFEGTPTACGTCHAGGAQRAEGKPMNHVPSSNRCGDCHVTSTWASALFDHSGVTGACATCHNGGTARGKPGDHPPTSNACETCHSTRSWTPAGFDHSGVTGACVTCHDGGTARGKPGDHPPSSNACETCHSTRSWTPASFDHSSVTGSCATCHNGGTATGKPGGHFVTSIGCEECHSTSRWTPVRYRHTGGTYPGDHAGSPSCTACHRSNAQTVAWPFASYAPDCAGCHANDFEPSHHRKVESPRILYTAGELRDCTGACHVYTDTSLSSIARARSGEHRVSRGDW